MANNRTHFVVSSGQFINPNPNLLVWEKFDVLNHLQNIGDAELTILEHWNEDGVILDYSYKIDTTQNTVLTNLSIALVAYNAVTQDRFEFDRISVNLNPNIGFPQIIDSENTRNYILPTSSQFNLVKLEMGAQSGDFRFYNGSLGQKMTWQEWIRNSGVNSIFYSNSEPNNNLNQEIDTYSGENGYEIHLVAIANVDSNVGSFEYERYSTVINVYDYLESDDGVITAGLIETFDATETVPLNGGILQDADTLFKVTWSGPAALDLADLGYIIHSIEPQEAPTNLQIEQSSTFRGIVTGGKLTALSTTQVGNTIVSRCLIKAGSLLDDNWKLSARIQTPGLPTAFGFILIHQTNPNGRNVTFTARKPIFANNKTFFSVNNDVTTADLRFRIGDATAALNDANDGGWAAFPEILWAAFVGTAIGEGVKVRVSYLGTSERTDLLSTIKVAVNESVIATVVNTIFTNSRIAANDVLLPFITENSVNLVTTQFTTNRFSEKRTDLEIANSSNLTDFATGIVPLTGLTNNAIGHLYAENTTANGIGQLSIQSVAITPSEGTTVAIGCPLSNFGYPVTGNGTNVQSIRFDKINDVVTTQANLFWNNIANDQYIIVRGIVQKNQGIDAIFSSFNTNEQFGLSFLHGNTAVVVAIYQQDTADPVFLQGNVSLVAGQVYNIEVVIRKRATFGTTPQVFYIDECYAVVNGRFIPLTLFNAVRNYSFNTTTQSQMYIGRYYIKYNASPDAAVNRLYYAGYNIQSTPPTAESSREFALGVREQMQNEWLFNNLIVSPTNPLTQRDIPNAGTIGTEKAIYIDGDNFLYDLF